MGSTTKRAASKPANKTAKPKNAGKPKAAATKTATESLSKGAPNAIKPDQAGATTIDGNKDATTVPQPDGVTTVTDKTVAAEEDGGKLHTVVVNKVGGFVNFATISVNGRPSRFQLKRPITVTTAELEALKAANAEISSPQGAGASSASGSGAPDKPAS